MPVPSSLASLSTTAASNSPSGGENPFPELDDHIRQGYAFDAQNRDAIATKLAASAVSAFALTLLDDANQAAAQVTLGIKRWDTGEWVLSAKTTAPAGTVNPNGGTIGSAASGATNRANADTADLFALLWAVTSNTDYPIQDSAGVASTRGASAAADFAANKRFPVPNIQDGDALVAAVSSAVLSRTVGANLAHTHTITVDGVPDHTHTFSVTGGNGGTSQITAAGGQAPATASTNAAGGHTHTASAASSGGSKNLAAGLMTRVYLAL